MLQYTVVENTVVKYNKNREEYYTIPMYSTNAIEIQFILDDSWKEYVITAQISNGEKTYNLLLQNNTAFIPADITAGIWNVSIFGVKGEEKRNTTIPSDFCVVEEGFKSDGQPPIPPEPDLYQKLLSEIQKGIEIAQSVRNDADAGKFNGEDGNGIERIELVNKVDKVTTYKIIFTNGEEFEYQIADGADGKNGVDGVGIEKIELVEKIEKTARYKITFTDGNYFEYEVLDGKNGKDGVTPEIIINATVNNSTGVPNVSVEKTGTIENPIFNLSFENLKGEKGENGQDGTDGSNGTDGVDGKSATITIGKVTTVSPNTPASVTNTGTNTDAVFNFEIPKGADGSGSADIETLEKIAIKTTIEGNPAMSGSSTEWRVPLIEGYGESTQIMTQGNQLFDINVYEGKSSAGAEATIDNGVIKIIGTPTKDTWVQSDRISIEDFKKYFKVGGLSIKPHKSSGCNFDFGIYINSTTVRENNSPYEITEEIYNNYSGDAYYFIDLKSSSSPSGYIQPMVYQTGSGEYEPYTGGAPSPSPDYPQEIKDSVVTGIKEAGANIIDCTQAINVTDKGNNFLKFRLWASTIFSDKYVNVRLKSNTKYYYSCNVIMNEAVENKKIFDLSKQLSLYSSNYSVAIFNLKDTMKNGDKIKMTGFFNTGTMPQDARILGYSERYTDEDGTGQYFSTITIEDFMISENPIAEYEPYKEQSTTLSTPITLRGIPSESGNVTIDGKKYLSDVIDKGKVTRYIGYIASYNGENVGNLWMSTTGQLTTGATVIYALAEPITEPLPAEDVQALADLKTFYPSSVINWETEDGAGVWTRAEIIHDPANYIDEKLGQITAQQTALQAELLKIGGSI